MRDVPVRATPVRGRMPAFSPALDPTEKVQRPRRRASTKGRERRVGGREKIWVVWFGPTGMGSGRDDFGRQQICWVK